MGNIKIYKIPQIVVVTMTTSNTSSINLPLTDTDFKVYQGVDNPINFVVKDENGLPIDLTNLTVSIVVNNFNNNIHLLTKFAEITNPTCGKFRIVLISEDIINWNLGFHRYSLLVDGTGSRLTQPLFMDHDHNAAGFFELLGGVTPTPKDSSIVLNNEWTPVSLTPGLTKYVSCAFPGDAFFCNNDGLHTVAVYTNNFTGKFWVQGSLLESTTQNDNDWFNVWLTPLTPEIKLNSSSGIEPFNFTGSIRWVRFVYMADPTNIGTIPKVAYRN